MDKKLKQFINKTKDIRLENTEKERLRENVLNFIKENPVRKPTEERLILRRTIFPFNLNLKTMPIIPAILALSLLTGGTSLAAEKSLPGDFLYPIKISINEEIRSIFSLSPESDAKWEIKRVERRLEEVEKLAIENKLPIELALSIEQNIKKHTEKIKSKIVELGNDQILILEISSNLEVVLDFHEKILDDLVVETKEIDILLPRIKKEGEIVKTIIIDISKDISNETFLVTQEIAKRELKLVKEDITEVRNLIAKIASRGDREKNKERIIRAQKYLIEAESLFEQGLSAFDYKKYSSSFITLKEARRILKIAKSLMAIPIPIPIPIDIDLSIDKKGGLN